MDDTSNACAREVLETAPLVMRFIRDQIRRRRAAGLSLLQYRTLAFLNRTRNPSLSTVAGHLGLSLPAMSRLINGLVTDRLVERQPVSTNRRQIALALAPRGRATLETVRNMVRRQLAGSLKSLSNTERNAVQQAMQALRRAFEPPKAAGNKTCGGKP